MKKSLLLVGLIFLGSGLVYGESLKDKIQTLKKDYINNSLYSDGKQARKNLYKAGVLHKENEELIKYIEKNLEGK